MCPLQYSFIDESIEKQYGNEQKMQGVFYAFAGLSLLIACLGLFGLSIFIVERKIKEIGIRKVLGASVGGIVGLLSKDFAKLVLISIVIATPIAWYFMNNWLEDFAYRITISWWVFALAGIIALLIALVTVSFQAIKAAIANPVKSLRTENNVTSDVAGFQNQIPGFDATAGFHNYGGSVTIPDGNNQPKKFDNKIEGSYSSTAIITWPSYFSIFNYEWLEGNAQSLNEPFKVVLTEGRAKKYFGNISPDKMIGKTIIYDDSLQVTVSGIVKDWTGNSDFNFTDFISVSTATHSFLKNQISTDDWSSLRPHNGSAFVKLSKGVTVQQINNRFASFIKSHINTTDGKLSMYLQPLSDIHFTSEYRRGDDGDDFRKAYMPTLYILMGVALFILIIAAINFINLSTAQSLQRLKEIGVRKVMGGNKKNIMLQFLTETFVLTVFAVVVSVLLVNPVLYLFKDFIPPGISFHFLQPVTFAFLTSITLITTLLAGFYPAKVLSSYMPALSLKGAAFQKGTEKLNLRKALIVFQFTMSLIFIIG